MYFLQPSRTVSFDHDAYDEFHTYLDIGLSSSAEVKEYVLLQTYINIFRINNYVFLLILVDIENENFKKIEIKLARAT